MTATERARRSDSLYYDTSTTHRRALCDMIANLESDLEESRAKNTKLQGLIKDYEHCNVHTDCSKCKYDGMTSTHCPLSPCFPDTDELRELGVKVN